MLSFTLLLHKTFFLFCPLVSTTHLVTELFQRSQKGSYRNTSTCICGTHSSQIQAVNTVSQHWNFLNHQTKPTHTPFLSAFFFPPLHLLLCSTLHISFFFLSPSVFVYVHQLFLLEKLSPHLCILSCHNGKHVHASLRLHQNARL